MNHRWITPFHQPPMSWGSRAVVMSYCLLLMLFSFGARLHPDAYYYWQWSHHLQAGYYDGPPLIAYVIWLFAWLLGQHPFSIHLIGVVTAAVTAWLIYHITQHLFDRRAANSALVIWFLTLGVVRFFFLENSYNSLLIVGWAGLLYGVIQLVEQKRLRDYYFCAVMTLWILYAKYSAVLLIFSLLIGLVSHRRYRFVFSSLHTWIAVLLIGVGYTPVLIWNYQHDWISFRYLFYHGFIQLNHYSVPFKLTLYLWFTVENYNVAVLALLFFIIRSPCTLWRQPIRRFLTIPILVVGLFFLIGACFSVPMMNWNAPCALTAAILLGYFLTRDDVNRFLYYGLLSILAIPTLLFAIGCRFPVAYILPDIAWINSYMFPNMITTLPIANYPNDPIITSFFYMLPSWLSSAFPARRNQIFALHKTGHQYYLWWQQALHEKRYVKGEQMLYVSYRSLDKLPAKFYPKGLDDCQLLSAAIHWQRRYFYHDIFERLYLYRCRFSGISDFRQIQ